MAKNVAVVFGEALIDLFPPSPGEPLSTAAVLRPRLGGAPANVAVHLARHGQSVELLSAVGDGPFGERIRRTLDGQGVGIGGVVVKPRLRTGLTLVQLKSDGERQFTAHRGESADLALAAEDLDDTILQQATLLHGGTVTLKTTSARAATAHARHQTPNALQTLDVNLRPGMFDSLESLCELAREEVKKVDVVKLAREEAVALYSLSDADSNEDIARRVLREGPALVFLTLDVDGAAIATKDIFVEVPSPTIEMVDATGAGDAFMGAALAQLPHNRADCEALDHDVLARIGTIACAAGANACTAMGACGDI